MERSTMGLLQSLAKTWFQPQCAGSTTPGSPAAMIVRGMRFASANPATQGSPNWPLSSASMKSRVRNNTQALGKSVGAAEEMSACSLAAMPCSRKLLMRTATRLSVLLPSQSNAEAARTKQVNLGGLGCTGAACAVACGAACGAALACTVCGTVLVEGPIPDAEDGRPLACGVRCATWRLGADEGRCRMDVLGTADPAGALADGCLASPVRSIMVPGSGGSCPTRAMAKSPGAVVCTTLDAPRIGRWPSCCRACRTAPSASL
mmetsp:Transcript_32990/g.60435  ORF Transcript_32990/g.60435 Transcript_32990/m.60435 type:complete len:262 (-) Transcript_32990:82-867(-)